MRTKTLSFLSISLMLSTVVGYLLDNTFLYSLSFLLLILLVWSVVEIVKKNHSILVNFPILGYGRKIMEDQRSKIRQYFNESDLDEVPFSREQRDIVYRRSKNQKETIPFGSIHQMYKSGYEFILHSMYPKKEVYGQYIKVGSKYCKTPYTSSRINISAMSFGALSGTAISALNMGALKGGFAHNTGEGGISEYHLKGGDLIFQIGTGYFGCGYTDENGVRQFDEEAFKVNANRPEVKMIEIKISQGAKPGHGGILPKEKNTEEIAKIRGIKPYETVHSPSMHTAFNNNEELIDFINRLRVLSNGKPVGIKMCVGIESEVISMLNTFQLNDNYPDFITVDGSEGGTGSALPEYTNFIGMPLLDGLTFMVKNLKMFNLHKEIRVFASGKIIDTFDIARVLALGADGVNIARGFMFSLGCIQARECNLDTCPVGVATQRKDLSVALEPIKKSERVYNYHHNTMLRLTEMMGTFGLDNIGKIDGTMIKRRMFDGSLKTLNEIYKY